MWTYDRRMRTHVQFDTENGDAQTEIPHMSKQANTETGAWEFVGRAGCKNNNLQD